MLRLLAFCLFAVLLCSTEGHRHEITICQYHKKSLDCGSGFIDILSAAYGRREKHICHKGDVSDTNCHAGSSMQVVRYECQGQHNCTLQAENSAFGDPCGGIQKYLRVDYACVSTPPFQGFLVRACEFGELDIHCPAKINIISANYGRLTGGHICDGSKASETTNCGAEGSIHIVRKKCHGKRECKLEASDSVFGDPCDGVYKYLEVRYECEK